MMPIFRNIISNCCRDQKTDLPYRFKYGSIAIGIYFDKKIVHITPVKVEFIKLLKTIQNFANI